MTRVIHLRRHAGTDPGDTITDTELRGLRPKSVRALRALHRPWDVRALPARRALPRPFNYEPSRGLRPRLTC